MQFIVGLKLKGKMDRMVVEAEDALIAALKIKAEYPERGGSVRSFHVAVAEKEGVTHRPPR